MPARRSKLVDEYIDKQPAATQRALKRVRSTIRQAIPDAEEVISYRIPAYKLRGGIAIFFAGWRGHYSIYPGTGRLVPVFKEALKPYEIRKGTIRFSLAQPVPAKLIERIAKYRAKEVRGREKTRRATSRGLRSGRSPASRPNRAP
jgi:uncharacterized protein YdhG (YjbR/CyaY superfamily)